MLPCIIIWLFFAWPLLAKLLTSVFLQFSFFFTEKESGDFDDFIFTKTVSIKGICKSGSKRNLHRVKQKRLELTGKCRKIFTGLKNNWEQTGNWKSIKSSRGWRGSGKMEFETTWRNSVDASHRGPKRPDLTSGLWALETLSPTQSHFPAKHGDTVIGGAEMKGQQRECVTVRAFLKFPLCKTLKPGLGPGDAPPGEFRSDCEWTMSHDWSVMEKIMHRSVIKDRRWRKAPTRSATVIHPRGAGTHENSHTHAHVCISFPFWKRIKTIFKEWQRLAGGSRGPSPCHWRTRAD